MRRVLEWRARAFVGFQEIGVLEYGQPKKASGLFFEGEPIVLEVGWAGQSSRISVRRHRSRSFRLVASASEFIRQHLALVLEQYRWHPKPKSAGIVRALTDRGDERELFAGGR